MANPVSPANRLDDLFFSHFLGRPLRAFTKARSAHKNLALLGTRLREFLLLLLRGGIGLHVPSRNNTCRYSLSRIGG